MKRIYEYNYTIELKSCAKISISNMIEKHLRKNKIKDNEEYTFLENGDYRQITLIKTDKHITIIRLNTIL